MSPTEKAKLAFCAALALFFILCSIASQIDERKPTCLADWVKILCWAAAFGMIGFVVGASIAQ